MPTDYAIKDGRTVFDATTYTGNGSTQSITNAGGFKPDFVWVKGRSAATSNILQDSVRGAGKSLVSNTTGAETGTTGDLISSFNSNGFTVNINLNGGTDPSTDLNGTTYVGWQWQAGQGTTSSNTNGSITSTVSVNATAGFSIVTYTGTGASGSVGHGLSSAPKFVITKARNSASWNWLVNIGPITGTEGDYLYLNATQAKLNSSNVKNPTSTTLPLVTSPENNGSGLTFVSYCWSEIAGFSKFGSYTGNGSTDGPFVYTGFRPKCIIVKITNDVNNWFILDTTRSTYNVAGELLLPNATNAGSDYPGFDVLSNGFKLRNTGTGVNTSGSTYLYAAFAENPFKYANAR